MIATIRRVWPSGSRVDVIARDVADGRTRQCFVWLPDQQWIAALCTGVSETGQLGVTRPATDAIGAPVVLTLAPASRYGYHIEAAELLPTAPEAQP